MTPAERLRAEAELLIDKIINDCTAYGHWANDYNDDMEKTFNGRDEAAKMIVAFVTKQQGWDEADAGLREAWDQYGDQTPDCKCRMSSKYECDCHFLRVQAGLSAPTQLPRAEPEEHQTSMRRTAEQLARYVRQAVLEDYAVELIRAAIDAEHAAAVPEYSPIMILSAEQIKAIDDALMTEEGVADAENVRDVATSEEMSKLIYMAHRFRSLIAASPQPPVGEG